MKYLLPFAATILSFVCSCDPGGTKLFLIDNKLPYTITTRIDLPTATPSHQIDTIKADSIKSIYSIGVTGIPATELIEGSQIRLYFDTLRIYRNDTLIYCQCPTDAAFWNSNGKSNQEELTFRFDTTTINR